MIPERPGRGSALLATELRRLRGSRSLREMEARSRGPASARLSGPLSSSALNAIENGKQCPSAETVLRLATLYGCSPQLLLLWVRLDRLRRSDGAPPCAEALRREVEEALAAGDPERALPLILRERALAEGGEGEATARLHLGLALDGLGLPAEAAEVLWSSLEAEAGTGKTKLRALEALRRSLARAGNLEGAEAAALREQALAAEWGDAEAETAASLAVASLRLRRAREGRGGREGALRGAESALDVAERNLGAAPGPALRGILLALRGGIRAARGDAAGAERELREAFGLLVRERLCLPAAEAAADLASLLRARAERGEARRLLAQAEALAQRGGDPFVQRRVGELLAAPEEGDYRTSQMSPE